MDAYYKRNLPHYQPQHAEFFITFRLANSIPQTVLDLLKQEKDLPHWPPLAGKKGKGRGFFKNFDQYLDSNIKGEVWLNNDEVATIVATKLHELDQDRYDLICYCIMPNHVHLLIALPDRDESRSTYPIAAIMHNIKGSTARRANQLLDRTGAFWQHESYDHVVRNEDERERIIQYILNNPVKAGLAKNWQEWKWTYCKENYLPY